MRLTVALALMLLGQSGFAREPFIVWKYTDFPPWQRSLCFSTAIRLIRTCNWGITAPSAGRRCYLAGKCEVPKEF